MRTARDLSLIALILVAACTTDRTRRAYLRDNAAFHPPPERSVIVIPGFGVTRLFDPVTRRHVWGTPRTTMRTRYDDDLDLPSHGESRDRLIPRGYVGSRGPVNIGWQLTEALRNYGRYVEHRDVHPFYYDWRLGAEENARSLEELAARVSRGRKVDLLTHSAGALIALSWIKLAGGGDRVDRVIMIAPPRRGVVDALRIFVRPEQFMRRRFPPAMVATWPSVYELLPDDGRILIGSNGEPIDFDVWRAETWTRLGAAALPDARLLRQARAFRNRLEAAAMPPGVRATILAGDCVPTARRALLRDDGSFAFYRDELSAAEQHLQPLLFEEGDGTVPVSSARAGGEALLFCDGHQGLATDPNVHRAILRALR